MFILVLGELPLLKNNHRVHCVCISNISSSNRPLPYIYSSRGVGGHEHVT